MPVVITEIVTEVVLSREPGPAGAGGAAAAASPAGTGLSGDDLDLVVRRASERVLEILRQEWDR